MSDNATCDAANHCPGWAANDCARYRPRSHTDRRRTLRPSRRRKANRGKQYGKGCEICWHSTNPRIARPFCIASQCADIPPVNVHIIVIEPRTLCTIAHFGKRLGRAPQLATPPAATPASNVAGPYSRHSLASPPSLVAAAARGSDISTGSPIMGSHQTVPRPI